MNFSYEVDGEASQDHLKTNTPTHMHAFIYSSQNKRTHDNTMAWSSTLAFTLSVTLRPREIFFFHIKIKHMFKENWEVHTERLLPCLAFIASSLALWTASFAVKAMFTTQAYSSLKPKFASYIYDEILKNFHAPNFHSFWLVFTGFSRWFHALFTHFSRLTFSANCSKEFCICALCRLSDWNKTDPTPLNLKQGAMVKPSRKL